MLYVLKYDLEFSGHIKKVKIPSSMRAVSFYQCRKIEKEVEIIEITAKTRVPVPDMFMFDLGFIALSPKAHTLILEIGEESVQFLDLRFVLNGKIQAGYKLLNLLKCKKDLIDFERSKITFSSGGDYILGVRSLVFKQAESHYKIFRLSEYKQPIIVTGEVMQISTNVGLEGVEFIQPAEYST